MTVTRTYHVTKPAPVQEPDEYDRAVAYLTEHPDEIDNAWSSPIRHPQGMLFRYASPNGSRALRADGKKCGCLTMIKFTAEYPGKFDRYAFTDDITAAIIADPALPSSSFALNASHLPAFARWQRILDVELRRDWSKA